MTQQPQWKRIANLGDVNPIDHGGRFVYVDETGVYAPECVILEEPCDDGPEEWTEYRFILEPCTHVNGVLSDNKFHPDHAAWFADKLDSIASYVGQSTDDLIAGFCSADPIERAHAYLAVADYFGPHEFDSYPQTFTSKEIEQRYPD